MAKSSAQPLLLGLFALAVIGFLFKFVWGPPPRMPDHLQAPETENYRIADVIDINVYLDTSGSIKHFLADEHQAPDASASPRLNYLRDLLNKCESALASAGAKESNKSGSTGWNGNTVRFWRFGDKVAEMQGQGALQKISDTPSAFTARQTRIEDPVTHTPQPANEGNRPELKILITDLYQSGGALEKPAEELVKKYLSNDEGAVGVIAVRNPLDGEVEDLPGTPPGEALHGAADTMPFYIIVAGPAPDVRHAMETLLDRTRLKEAQAKGLLMQLFFSRKAAVRASSPATIEGKDFSPVTDDYEGQGIKLIELPQTSKVQATWPEPPSGSGELRAVTRMTPSVFSFDPQGKAVANPEALAAAMLCGTGPCVAIDGTKLAKGAYRIQLDRVATQGSRDLEPDSESKLLNPWNIERQDAERISRGTKRFPADPPLTGNPGKTPDLSKFLSTLQGAMFHSPLRISSYFLYVQVD